MALASPRATGSGYMLDSSGGDNACVELLPAEDNILLGIEPIVNIADFFDYNGGNYYETQTTDFGCLTDGKIPKVAGGNERTDARALIPRNSTLTYELERSVALSSVRIYTQWSDGYRNDVSVKAIEVRVNNEWQTLDNSSFSYARRESRNLNVSGDYDHNLVNRRVVFEDLDDGVLAKGVEAIRITFGDQSPTDDSGDDATICYGAYWEVEATEAGEFEVKNTVNGSSTYTGLGEVVPQVFPEVEGYSEYQITVGESEPVTDGWKTFVSGVPSTDLITFDLPQQLDAVTTFTLHLRGDGVEAKTYTAKIKSAFGSVPVVNVNGAITKCLPNAVDGALVKGEEIVSMVSASDSHGGILSVTAEDQFVTADDATVTYTVRNLAGATTGSMSVTTIPYTGLFDNNDGYLTRMLHLGANFDTDDLTHGGINDDRLVDYWGEAYQLPYPGLVYTGLATNGKETYGQLTWTPTAAKYGSVVYQTWKTDPNRDYYVKYWFVYVYCPEDRIVRLCNYFDDDIRVWINGELKVSLDGCGNSVKTDGVQLRKGLNAVLMKLREGGGGDLAGLSIRPDPNVNYGRTWPGGNNFGDLRYQFCPDFQIEDAVSGHPYITTSGRVKVRYMPKLNGYTKYQVVADGVEPAADGWKAYDPQAIPDEAFAYEGIENAASVSMTVYLSDESGANATNFTASLAYRSDIAGPELNLKDVSVVQLRSGAPVTVNAKLFDNGMGGNYRFLCEPSVVTQSGEVTVTVVNKDGGMSSETRNVTIVPGYGPLPSGYLTTLLHLGADFVNDSCRDGGIDDDILKDFGGEANQRPYEGLVTKGLVWSVMYDADGQWSPNKDHYNKYWHVYVTVPGTESRTVRFYTRQDDDVRIWRDGELIVNSIGWDNNAEKGPYEATLHPGQNSLTIRLREGDGGDNMAVRIADANGQPFTDLTFSLEPLEFGIKCVESASEEFTADGEVGVISLPFSKTAEYFQLSATGDPASLTEEGWVAYPSSRATSATLDFGDVTDGQVLTGYCFLKNQDGSVVKYESYNTLTVSTEAPTVIVRTAALDIDPEKGYRINPNDLNDGSLGGASGIVKMWTAPEVIFEPGEVTLYVMNGAGLVSSATVTVTLDSAADRWVSGDGSDATGNGTEANPYRTITRVLESSGTSLRRINVKPGTYNPAAGENFPIVLPDNVTIVGCPTETAGIVIDAGDSAENVIKAETGSVGARHVELRNSTDALVRATGESTHVTLENCTLVQTTEIKDSVNRNVCGALSVAYQAVIEATACRMSNMRRDCVIYYSNTATVLLSGCEIADNNLGHSTVHAANGWGGTLRVMDCDFLRNVVPDAVPHDSPYSCFGYFCRIHLTVDRSRFIDNRGGCFMGLNYTASEGNTEYSINNTLIAGTVCKYALYCGYQGRMISRNCTYVGNSGGYSARDVKHELYNCILVDEGALTGPVGHNDWSSHASGLILHDTVLYNCLAGDGYNQGDSSNVFTFDPLFRDAANGDYTLQPYSPAIDAGVNDNTYGDFDLVGNIRVANNSEAELAKVDLGCHESLFHAATEPTFLVPVPGKMACYRGVAYEMPVSIAPAVSEGIEEVTAKVTLGEGLSSAQTELVFNAANDWTATLAFEVASGSYAEQATILIEDAAQEPSVLPETMLVTFGDLILSIGGKNGFYIREGETVSLPVSLALDGALAPGNVPFSIGAVSGEGSNTAVWSDDAQYIPGGAHSSVGRLVLTGGSGVNTVTVSCGATFAETDADSVTINIYGYPGYYYVDSANGVDAEGRGTEESPFRTIGYALERTQPGDTIRLLPGTYSSATETLPLSLGKVNLKGMGTKPEDVVFTGSDEASGLVTLADGDAVQIENMVLRDTSGPLFDLNGATLVLTDVRVTQATANNNVAGAVLMKNDSVLTATNATFTGIVRKAVVFLQSDAHNGNRINLMNCRFADNLSDYATLSTDTSNGGIWRVEGCDFENNRVTPSVSALSDAYRSTVLFGRIGADAEFNRCRFLGNAEGNVIGVSGDSKVTIANTLIAGNYAPGNLFRSFNTKWNIRSCTFAGNYGGVWCQLGAQSMDLYNCIFAGNSALVQHAADNREQHPQDACYHNCLVYDTPIIVGEFADGKYPKFRDANDVLVDGPTYTVDPKLRKPLKWTGEASAEGRPTVNWATYTAKLDAGSPALNVGRNDWIYGDKDIDGNPRLQDDDDHVDSPRLDLGAYEGRASISFTVFIR